MGKLAISLLAIITARRIHRRFQAQRMVSDLVAGWGLRVIAPLELLRGSVVRTRSY
jgi:hypothetical protein